MKPIGKRANKIFITASWGKRDRVRKLAEVLRIVGYDVYDFTDGSRRKVKPVPPEKNYELFDPQTYPDYWRYLNVCRADLKAAVRENKRKLNECDTVILLLPCGIDATADWAYALGRGKRGLISGFPNAGERTAWHFHAHKWFPDDECLFIYLTVGFIGQVA